MSAPVDATGADFFCFSTFIALVLFQFSLVKDLTMRPVLNWPLPVGDLGPIHAELMGVVFTRNLLVQQGLTNVGAFDSKTRYPINSIDCQAEAIGLIANG